MFTRKRNLCGLYAPPKSTTRCLLLLWIVLLPLKKKALIHDFDFDCVERLDALVKSHASTTSLVFIVDGINHMTISQQIALLEYVAKMDQSAFFFARKEKCWCRSLPALFCGDLATKVTGPVSPWEGCMQAKRSTTEFCKMSADLCQIHTFKGLLVFHATRPAVSAELQWILASDLRQPNCIPANALWLVRGKHERRLALDTVRGYRFLFRPIVKLADHSLSYVAYVLQGLTFKTLI